LCAKKVKHGIDPISSSLYIQPCLPILHPILCLVTSTTKLRSIQSIKTLVLSPNPRNLHNCHFQMAVVELGV
jgi:hypothetical protein